MAYSVVMSNTHDLAVSLIEDLLADGVPSDDLCAALGDFELDEVVAEAYRIVQSDGYTPPRDAATATGMYDGF